MLYLIYISKFSVCHSFVRSVTLNQLVMLYFKVINTMFWTFFDLFQGILGAGLSIFVCWKALKSTRRGANMDFASSRNVVVTVGVSIFTPYT